MEEKLFAENEYDVFSLKFFDEKIIEVENWQVFKVKKETPFLREPKIQNVVNFNSQIFTNCQLTKEEIIESYYNIDHLTEFLPLKIYQSEEYWVFKYYYIPPFNKLFYPNEIKPPQYAADYSRAISNEAKKLIGKSLH